MGDYCVTVGTSGVRRETGQIVSIKETEVVFQYKKRHTHTILQIVVPASRLLCLLERGKRSEIVYLSNPFNIADYPVVTDVKASVIKGIQQGKTRLGEKFHFSPTETTVTKLIQRERAQNVIRVSKPEAPKPLVKVQKGHKIEAKKW